MSDQIESLKFDENRLEGIQYMLKTKVVLKGGEAQLGASLSIIKT
jgi:hypothetical protein